MSATRTSWDSSTNKDVFKTLVDEWFNSTDREELVEWQKMCLNLGSGDEYERRGRWAGLKDAEEVPEGQNITIQTPKFGGTKDYTQVSYGTGFRITDRMKRFEKIGLYEFLTKDLRRAQRETKDIEIAKMWNNPTATTYAAGFDTLALGHDAHTCLDDAATTYDNLLSAALSTSSLESGRNYFDYMYDDQGNIFTAKPDLLTVNYQLVVTAEEIMGSSLKAHELSNTTNYFKSYVELFDYHRLTSATAWYLCARKHSKWDYFVYTTVEPDIRTGSAPDTTRDTIVDSLQYFKFGFGDPRMAYVGNT